MLLELKMNYVRKKKRYLQFSYINIRAETIIRIFARLSRYLNTNDSIQMYNE